MQSRFVHNARQLLAPYLARLTHAPIKPPTDINSPIKSAQDIFVSLVETLNVNAFPDSSRNYHLFIDQGVDHDRKPLLKVTIGYFNEYEMEAYRYFDGKNALPENAVHAQTKIRHSIILDKSVSIFIPSDPDSFKNPLFILPERMNSKKVEKYRRADRLIQEIKRRLASIAEMQGYVRCQRPGDDLTTVENPGGVSPR